MINLKKTANYGVSLSYFADVVYNDSHLQKPQYYQEFVHLLEALILIGRWNITEIAEYVRELINTWR
jgi:hypothetical protein